MNSSTTTTSFSPVMIIILMIITVIVIAILSINTTDSYTVSTSITETTSTVSRINITWTEDNLDKTFYRLRDLAATKQGDNIYVTLYRTVPKYRIINELGGVEFNIAYPPALIGNAVPRAILNNCKNPQVDIHAYNHGKNWTGTDSSLLVGFSMNLPWVLMFVESQPKAEDWVLLIKTFKLSDLIFSPNRFDEEYEWFYKGTVYNCLVVPSVNKKKILELLQRFQGF